MLKNPASGVLARHCRLTISAAFTNVTRFIQRVVNLRGSMYRSVRFVSSLAAALLDSLFEHPEVILVAPYGKFQPNFWHQPNFPQPASRVERNVS
jgi:hypothetical protein